MANPGAPDGLPSPQYDDDDPRRPLLQTSARQWPSKPSWWSDIVASYGPLPRLIRFIAQMVTHSTVKATVAYLVATLPTFLGLSTATLQASSHLFAASVLYFHPARTIGAMLEALVCCVVGLSVGFLVATGCLKVAIHYEETGKNATEADVIALTTLAVVTFVLAFIRAKFGVDRPAIATGCTMTHLLTFITITQMSLDHALPQLGAKITRVATLLFLGTCVSFLSCLLLWPTTAASALRQEISKTLGNLQSFFDVLSNTFSLSELNIDAAMSDIQDGDDDPPGPEEIVELEIMASRHQQLQELMQNHQRTLLRMETLRYEIGFEFFSTMYLHHEKYLAVLQSVQRLGHHLGGLESSIIQVDQIVSQDDDRLALVEFMEIMGPSLRRLVITCKQSIGFLHMIFSTIPHHEEDANITIPALLDLAEKLAAALEAFDQTQKNMLQRVYKRVHEDLFLVFFFVFELMEIGKELIRLVEAVEFLKADVLERRRLGKVRWTWGAIWQRKTSAGHSRRYRRVHLHRPSDRPVHSQPNVAGQRHSRVMSMPAAFGLQHDPSRSGSLGLRIWAFFTSLRKFEVRFALKTALAVALMALPAFLEDTRELFYDYRMHWSLSTFVVVMTPSVGGTNAAGLYRLLGTMGGATTALLAGLAFSDNPTVLFLISAVVCLPCMYVWLHTQYPRIGQIFLLTYTIILLNDYAGNVDPVTGREFNIREIAFRRGLAVGIGCVMGIFVSWYIWPFRAREALRVGLSNTLFDIGLLYNKIVGLFDSAEETTPEKIQEFMEDEFDIRLALAELRVLLGQTAHEPRLKGGFPRDTYAKMIRSTVNILDNFVSMRVAMTKTGFSEVRKTFIYPIQPLRQKMIGAILLYLYLLSGALILRYPLPPQLPDARERRDHLLDAIRALPAVQPQHVGTQEDPAYVYYYAYLMGMGEVINELDSLGRHVVDLFGVMVVGV
ncbi:hypothetical protein HDU85_005766 [Gaertneriomyces sp. JEL0708]|nr:hypothetical protein HDU85_005766 [Gaertneriomyces sp. JEL0708]